jgi:hypothetical protein
MLGGLGGLGFRARVPFAGFQLRTPKARLALLRFLVLPGFTGARVWLMLQQVRQV